MSLLLSFLSLICVWGSVFCNVNDRKYDLKLVFGHDCEYQKPSCIDYFKNSNINFDINPASSSYSSFNISDKLEDFCIKPLSCQVQNELDMMSYEDFEGQAISALYYPHGMLNYYNLYDHSYFKEFIKRNCDHEIAKSHLQWVKKRYCTEKDFHEQADQLPFNLFEEADDLLSEITRPHAAIEIEDFYQEYKHFSYGNSLHAQRYKKRCEAMKNQYDSLTKTTKLHPLTKKLLKDNGIKSKKFKKFSGSAFQMQLYDEFNQILNQVSSLKNCSSVISNYIPDIVSLVDIGQSFNKRGFLIKAALVADFCWSFISACAQGIALGSSELADYILHPIDSTIGLMFNISSIAYHLGRLFYQIADISALASLQHLDLYDENDYQHLSKRPGINLIFGNEANQQLKILCNNCSTITKSFYEHMKNLSWQDNVKYAVSIGTEIFLTKKCAKTLHNITNKACARATQIIQQLDAKVITAEAALVCPGNAMVQIVGQASQVAHELAESKPLLPLPINKAKGPFTHFKEYIIELKETIPQLKKRFDGVIIQCGEKSLAVSADYEHLFMFEIKQHYKKKFKQCIPRLNGFHHDYLGKLEESGIVRYVNIKEGLHGTYKADVIVNGIKFEGKTFFPQFWNHEKVLEKIFESLQNLIDKPILQKNGNWQFKGITSEGIKIETIVDVKNEKIITAFPKIVT